MALVVGIDEVGRGPLAGPVVVAAVAFEKGYRNGKIRDSKQLSASARELILEEILSQSEAGVLVSAGPQYVDQENVRQATKAAMELALNSLLERQLVAGQLQAGIGNDFEQALIDGNMELNCRHNHRAVIGGDAIHVEIGAASIIAKVWRDRLLLNLDREFPRYGFGQHKGYGTKQHLAALSEFGPCAAHRLTFAPVRNAVRAEQIGGLFETQKKRAWDRLEMVVKFGRLWGTSSDSLLATARLLDLEKELETPPSGARCNRDSPEDFNFYRN